MDCPRRLSFGHPFQLITVNDDDLEIKEYQSMPQVD